MTSLHNDLGGPKSASADSVHREGHTMSVTSSPPEGWRSVATPPSLFRRFEFASYRETRAFLERLGELSKETGLYPDLGFGTTHVNVTIYAPNGAVPGVDEVDFANRAAALAIPG